MEKFYTISFKDEEYHKVSDYLSKNIKNSIIITTGFCQGYLSKGKKGGTILLGTARDDLSGTVTINENFSNSKKIKEDLTKLLEEIK